jgi:hypothetical protein
VRKSPETLPTIVPDLARAVLAPFLGAEQTEAFIIGHSKRAENQ